MRGNIAQTDAAGAEDAGKPAERAGRTGRSWKSPASPAAAWSASPSPARWNAATCASIRRCWPTPEMARGPDRRRVQRRRQQGQRRKRQAHVRRHRRHAAAAGHEAAGHVLSRVTAFASHEFAPARTTDRGAALPARRRPEDRAAHGLPPARAQSRGRPAPGRRAGRGDANASATASNAAISAKTKLCAICASAARDAHLLCAVEIARPTAW